MKNLLLTLTLFLSQIFLTCTMQKTIDYRKMEGYYQYTVYDYKTHQPVDTVYSTVRVLNSIPPDTLVVDIDIYRTFLGTPTTLRGILGIYKKNDKLIPWTYRVFDTRMKNGSVFYVGIDLYGEGCRACVGQNFTCKNTNMTIEISPERELENILLLEERNWHDIGGYWDVMQYGFDKDFKIVYKRGFNERRPWDNKRMTDFTDYLILEKFIPDTSITDIEHDKFVSRSPWTSWRHKLEDYIPPPRPILKDSSEAELDFPPPPPE